jgi:hypothetical protein
MIGSIKQRFLFWAREFMIRIRRPLTPTRSTYSDLMKGGGGT